MSSEEIVISARNLSKSYRLFGHPGDRIKQFLSFGLKQYHREFTALKDVSFDIKKGETVGIIGRNGSGKSTLLQLICGILKPTAGTVQVKGRVSALLELGAGFNPEFTGRENVLFQGALMGFTRTQMDERFADIAAFADIGEFIDQPVRTYSSGMFVRLAFSVIAHLDADILVIDEALSVGDANFAQKCMRYLGEFHKHGTILLVSHDIASITSMCNRVLWLDNAGLAMNSDAKESCEAYLTSILGIPELKSAYTSHNKDNCAADQRQDLICGSTLRNDLEVGDLNWQSASAGTGSARIVKVRFENDEGSRYGWIVGGELVNLVIRAESYIDMAAPILGFMVKNRFGQAIIGDNTYLSYATAPVAVFKGDLIEARFKFRMPRLPVGSYSIVAAIAEGTQQQKTTHHLLHEAVIFQSHSSSVGQVLVGLPMLDINLTVTPDHATEN